MSVKRSYTRGGTVAVHKKPETATVHAHLDHIFKKMDVYERHAAMKKFSKHL